MVKYLHVVPLGKSKSLKSFSKVIVDLLSSKNMLTNNKVFINNKNATKDDLMEVQCYIKEKFDTQDDSFFDTYKFFNALINYERVVFHELPSVTQRLLYGFFLHLLNRQVDWVVWGGDLYDQNYFALVENDTSKSLKLLILKLVNKFFVSKVNCIYSVRDDFCAVKLVHKNMNFKFKELYYPVPLPNVPAGSLKDRKRILISHSASHRNNHYEVLNLVKSIDNGEVEILAILSYGEESPEVVDDLIKTGFQLFGSRFVPIRDFLDQDSYWELLSTVNISISLSRRQSSIFTTAAMLSLGVKILMYSDISPYSFYTDNGLSVYDVVTELKNSDVLAVDEDLMIENSIIAKNLWSLNKVSVDFLNEFNGLDV